MPYSLSEEEVLSFIQMYVDAARKAMVAGFGRAEIHGTGGYLTDQFTQDVCNTPSDSPRYNSKKSNNFCKSI